MDRGNLQTAGARAACDHCGAPCDTGRIASGGRVFCCAGCRTVFDLLTASGLDRFYELEPTPGTRMADAATGRDFAFLDDVDVRRRILDFSDGTHARVTFRIPAIHCVACVWLLENLYRLRKGIGRSEVNFARKTVAIAFAEAEVKLSGVASLLASLGYEPDLNLGSVEEPERPAKGSRRLVTQIGVAGFAFGNIMLLSFPTYLGLNPATEATLQHFFGLVSLVIALPVVAFSALDYWTSAWLCLRRRVITIDLPIAVGLAALFLQSLYDIVGRHGEGYLDSFAGLVFLLLVGRWFQRRTTDSLAFDRTYRSYFPLSVLRREKGTDTAVPITKLQVGDRILVRNRELIPADAVVMSGDAWNDCSFVTGEATPVPRRVGDYVYAGGRQAGGAIELETVKDVSQSYLTSLWNDDAFRKPDQDTLHSLTNIAGRWFTYAVLAVSLVTGVAWAVIDPSKAVRALTAVLLVACPCTLSIAAPFTLGTSLRVLARRGLYLRNPLVVERLAATTSIVFDKTGTLTTSRSADVSFQGRPLLPEERDAIGALARQSTHPLSRQIGAALGGTAHAESVAETEGCGVEGRAGERTIRLGSKAWIGGEGDDATAVYVSINGTPRGRFVVRSDYRPHIERVIADLGAQHELSVVSGDNEGERPVLAKLYGPDATLKFGQSPHDKLAHIRSMQEGGRRVLMIGDGLNDAGALKQSDVGMALAEDIASFSPACDAILDAQHFGRLPAFLRFSERSVRLLKAAFAISLTYNAVAIGVAMSGHLSPMISAILMPISSFTVISFSVGTVRLLARRMDLA